MVAKNKKFKNISGLLKKRRAYIGITQNVLAAKIGISGQLVSNIERGKCSIPASKINKLAAGLIIKPEIVIEYMVADEFAYLNKQIGKVFYE